MLMLNPIQPGLFEGNWAWQGARGGGGGGEGGKCPRPITQTINDNEMKFGGVVENQKLINLVSFNCRKTSSLRQ